MAAICIGIAVALASADSVTADIGFGPPESAPATYARHVAVGELMAGLRGSDKTGNGSFGVSVSLSADGSTAVIGASGDNGGVGAAWVFTRSGGVWTQQGPKLTGSDKTRDGSFGFSVSLSADGSTAAIGAAGDNGRVGAAWVFTRSGGVWTQQGPKLTGSDETGNGVFGSVSLSADGSTAVIGASGDNGGVGAAWVFTRSGGVWTQQGPKLTGSGETGVGSFGSVSLSADGSTAVIGAFSDNGGVGAAWVFTRSGGVWTQQGPKLTGSGETGNGGFGGSVSLSADGSTAVIGAPDDDGAGAAWVFTRSGGVWTQQGPKLTGSDKTRDGSFGFSVSLSADGSTAVISAAGDNGGAGAAWVFMRSGGVWTQQGSKLTGSDEAGNGSFGFSVSLSADGSTAVISAAGDDGGAGAAWVFMRSGGAWTQQGTKVTASSPSIPLPIVARTANAQPVKGAVLVKQPGKRGFVQLSAATHIPIGSELDTTKGTVSLTTAAGGGKVQSGLFHGGLFKLGQKKGKHPFTELALAASLRCVNSRASAHAGAKRRTSRQLFGDAHGRFRMRGRHSVATVRGTKWLVKDTCNSTLTVSQRGTVVVQDLVKHRTITLHTGQRYLARRGNR
jgi:hypothetical protein